MQIKNDGITMKPEQFYISVTNENDNQLSCTDPPISRSIGRSIRFNNFDEKYTKKAAFCFFSLTLILRDLDKDSVADNNATPELFATSL